MFVLITFIFFLIVQQCIDVALNPWPRLMLIPFFLGIYYYKDQFDFKLGQSLKHQRTLRILKIVFLLALLVRGGVTAHKIYRPVKGMEDIAEVYTKSVDVLFKKGENPYNHPVDPKINIHKGMTRYFDTIKYPPFLILYYAPLTLPFGPKGILIGNFLAVLAIFLAIFFLLRKISPGHGYLGGVLFLSTDYFFTKAFNRGINDFLPTALILFSLILMYTDKRVLSGLLLGLSVASKQTPAGIFVIIYLCQKRWKEFLVCTLAAFACIIPFWATAIIPFFRNVIELNLYRGIREDSFSWYFPAPWPSVLFFSAIVVIGIVSYKGALKDSRWNLTNNWNLATIAPFWLLFFFKMAPANYYIWTYPFIILWYLTPKDKLILDNQLLDKGNYQQPM